MSKPIRQMQPVPIVASRVAGATSIFAVSGALACGACCVLPFAAPTAIVALTGGAMAWLGGVMPLVRDLAAVAVTGGWVWVGVQSFRTKRRAATSTIIVMFIATALLAGALAWPHFEGTIAGLLHDR